jgi:hypothetical protein
MICEFVVGQRPSDWLALRTKSWLVRVSATESPNGIAIVIHRAPSPTHKD